MSSCPMLSTHSVTELCPYFNFLIPELRVLHYWGKGRKLRREERRKETEKETKSKGKKKKELWMWLT